VTEGFAGEVGAAALLFGYFLLTFHPMEVAFPARPGQGFFRPGWRTDACFFLGQHLFFVGAVYGLLLDLSPWLHGLLPPEARRVFGLQPYWLQLVEVVLIGDCLIYWGHRLQHRFDFLWRFHAVHHSAEHLDFMAAHREHPMDTIYSVAIMNLPATMIGFPPDTMAAFLAFRGLWAIFIHSNVRVRLGTFGILVGSPEFHHWHHAKDRESVNFGNVSPLMDVIFGTHHDPGHLPEAYGLREPVAGDYLSLMLQPMLPQVWPGTAPSGCPPGHTATEDHPPRGSRASRTAAAPG
jgi:sterol desaturase/sphingolipid hydroxylase (fatty acid hydroxylase superfamily)